MYLKKAPTVEQIVQRHRVPLEQITEELKIGIAYELLYTESNKIAENIALNHIYECYYYYSQMQSDLFEYKLSYQELTNNQFFFGI